MTRAAIYARFSSDLQSDHSVEDQLALCRAYAERQGWSVAGLFSDRAASGASVHGRPDYARMLALGMEGGFDVMLAEDLDRFSRNLADTARLHERMGFLGIRLWTVSDGEIGDMHVGLKGTMSAMFLKNLAAKTRRGMAGVVRDGRHAGGRAYGYRTVAGRPGALEIEPAEAEIVREIFARYIAGETPRAIAAILNARHVAPPRGTVWSASTINGNRQRGHGMLLNPVYAGRIVWNRVRMVKDPDTGRRISRVNEEGEWQSAEAPQLRIVDDATFAAAGAIKQGRGGPRPQDRRKPRHMLSGLLRCGCCGGGMSVKDRRGARVRIVCTRSRETGTCDNRRAFPLDRIERSVVAGLRNQLSDRAAIELYVSTYNEERQRLAADLVRDYAATRRALDRAEGELQRTIDLAIKGVISSADAERRLPLLTAERDVAAMRLAASEAPPLIVTLHPAALADYLDKVSHLEAAIAEGIAEGSEASQRALRNLIETITIQPPAMSGGDVDIEIRGHLSRLIGGSPFPTQIIMGGNDGSGRGT